MQPDNNDKPYIDMIQRIQQEKCFYFSYDIDLTKNMQKTLEEIEVASQG